MKPAKIALLSRSPVRMRITESTGLMKILPSPISPVRAASWMALTTVSTWGSSTTISSLSFCRNSTVNSEPR